MINEPKYDNEYTTKSYVDRVTSELNTEVITTKITIDGEIANINKTYGAAPNPPYFVGNLYVDGTNLYRCKTERLIGAFDAADWELATEYPTTSYVDSTYTKPADFLETGSVSVNGGRITAGSIKSAHYVANTTGMKIDLDQDIIDSKNFKVNSEGVVTATSGSFTGTVSAGAGAIGGFELLSSKLRTTDKKVGMASSTWSGDPVFWAGNVDPWENAEWSTNMPFYVTNAGFLKATNANITGAITATSGTFQNFSGGGLTLNSGGALKYYDNPGFLYCGGNTTNHPYVSALNVAALSASPGSGDNPGNQSISFRNSNSRTTAGSTIAYISHGWNGSTRFHTINNMNISSSGATGITAGTYLVTNAGTYTRINSGTYTLVTAGSPHSAQLGTNEGSVYIASDNSSVAHINLKAGGRIYAASFAAAGNYDGQRVLVAGGLDYSSKNIKKNIKRFKSSQYDDAISLLNKLNIYNYNYKYFKQYKEPTYGFIIDEIEELDRNKFWKFTTETGTITKTGIDFSNEIKGKKIDVKYYDKELLDRYLLTVCKAQQMKINDLEERIKKLEN